ncbi:MAG: hypothetical protein Q4F57_01645 [Weeksellaceae bacterium]|nr:hypothetical protein [Weeksellaceae bacterium]
MNFLKSLVVLCAILTVFSCKNEKAPVIDSANATESQSSNLSPLVPESPEQNNYEGTYILQENDNNPMLSLKFKKIDEGRYYLEIGDQGIKSCSLIGEVQINNSRVEIPMSNYIPDSKANIHITFDRNMAIVETANPVDKEELKRFCKNTATIAGTYTRTPQ